MKPNWREWLHIPNVRLWQACALSLNIDPHSLLHDREGSFTDESLPNQPTKEEFEIRLRVLRKHSSNRSYFSPGALSMINPDDCEVRLDEFANWVLKVVKWENIPPELVAMARAPDTQAVTQAETNGSNRWTPEKIAELRKEHNALNSSNHKSPTKELAKKHGISETRIRELIARGKKKPEGGGAGNRSSLSSLKKSR